MQKSLLFFIIFLTVSVTSSQNYYYNINRGVDPSISMSAPSGRIILSQPVDDQFSEVQQLPFTWQFYGQDVTEYIASDNGFITFDVNSTENTGNNTTLPTPGGPNNAIYALWDDIEFVNNPDYIMNDIKTYTYGSEPNRVHVIQWHATPKGKAGNSNYLYFAIRLYEGDDFDILYQQLRLSGATITATTGCENADGSLATTTIESPNFTYTGGTYVPENCLVHSYFYGERPSYDVVFNKLILPEIAGVDKTIDIIGEFTNQGSETVNSIQISYIINTGFPIVRDISGIDIPTNESHEFILEDEWLPQFVNEYSNIEVTISKVNDNDDENPKNNTLDKDVWVNNGYSATKKALIEEFSTAQCGFCPEGHIFLEEAVDNNENIVGFTHHSGFGTDSMTVFPVSTDIASEFTNGAPTAVVDRILWQGSIKHAISRYNNMTEKKNNWELKALERLESNAPVSLMLTHEIDQENRILEISVDADVIDYMKPGDIRLNVFVIEDSVSGEGPGYDQKNYYDGTVGHHFYGMGNPIIGYQHRHIIRASLTGSWGEANLFTVNPFPDDEVSKTYTWDIPERVKIHHLSIIAFVSYYDGKKYREIVNTEEIKQVITSFEEQITDNDVSLYPNPVSASANLRFDHNGGYLSIEIINPITGDITRITDGIYRQGQLTIPVDCTNLSQGVYILRMTSNNIEKRLKFIVVR